MMVCHANPSNRWSVVRVILIGALFLTGCANLQAVREFSKTSAATADYRQIVTDYVGSPNRQKRYQPERSAAQLKALADARAVQKPSLEGAQKVLVEYMAALGDLAADELPIVDNEIDALGNALEQAKFIGDADAAIKKETATAASTIVKVLSRAVLDHWRQSQVRQIIRETDQSLQTVVAGLREIVLKDFTASLDTEAEAIRKYFEKPIADATSRNEPDAVPPLARILWLEHQDQLAMRRGKLAAYAEVLTTIGKGHADLRTNIDKLDDEALKARLKQYAKNLQTLYKTVKELTV